MAQYSDSSKVSKIDVAFGQLVGEMVKAGDAKTARKALDAFEALSPDSKVKLFDILRGEG